MAAHPRTHVCRLVCLAAQAVLGCKTASPDAPPPIFSEPSLTAPLEGPRPARAASPALGGHVLPPPPPPPPTALAEELKPIRGGAKVLPPYLGPDPCHMAL